MSDPTRLRDGQGEERALLDALRAEAPSEEQSGAMWKVIAAQAAAVSVASTASAAKVVGAVVPKALAAKVALVVALGAAGVVYVQTRPAPVQPVVEQSVAVEASPPVPSPPPAPDLCTEAASDCTDAAAPLLEVAPPPVRAAKRARRVAAPTPLDTLQGESRLLALARAQLRAKDLAGAEQTLHHAREQFPDGALGQEREVMQIELLAALGDSEGADHRARRFLRKNPDSPHAKSVRRFLLEP